MIELPRVEGGFRAALIDPPWAYQSRTALQSANWNSRRDAEKHYSVMSLEEIKALPVRSVMSKDGFHCFLWITGPFMDKGFDVLKAYGCKYSTVAFVWPKLKRSFQADQFRFTPTIDSDFHVSLGLTTRSQCEFVLLGRRGNVRRNAKDVRQLILAPRREHSRKPDDVYTRIERYCDGPYLELFGRESRPGWTVWGNQSTLFDGK